MTRRIAVLAHGGFPGGAKTATGILRYADAEVVAVLDRDIVADDPNARVADYLSGVADAPIVASSAAAPDFDALVIGIAPIGGGFDETWRADVTHAIESGVDVVSGLHYFLADDPEFTRLAGEHDVDLWDVRRPPEDLTVAEGIARELDTEIITTVGTDCSTGKMTTTRELYEAAVDRGVDAGFIPTGQTGIIIEDWGIPIDRTVSDFTAGAVERMVRERSDHDYLFVEGQGSITHPAYSPVTLGILHGSMPDSLVLCHEAGRESIHGYEEFEIPNLGYVAELYESLTESVAPTEVVAGALNTAHLTESEADDAKARYRSQLTAPVADPIRDGVDELLEVLL